METPVSPGPGPGKGYETTDVRPVAVLPWFLVFVVLVLATLAGMYWLYAAFEARHEAVAGPGVLTPVTEETHLEPHLQVTPAVDLAEVRAAEQRILSSYEWVDRPNGVVRIPIERAIELTAARGLPVRAPR